MRRDNAMTSAQIVTISLSLARSLARCYTSHGTLTSCAKLPYSLLVMLLSRTKVLQIEFLRRDESRICKNPFCKWNLLFLEPRAMALPQKSELRSFDVPQYLYWVQVFTIGCTDISEQKLNCLSKF